MSARTRWVSFAAAGVLVLVGASAGHAQDSDAIERGNALFQSLCAPCHGAAIGDDGQPLLPGTSALSIKYRGALPAVLEERTDLTLDALRVYLRQGSFSMPPFRQTEITDTEIGDIAAYLTPP